ncbi:MAG: hypothetical protein ACRERC_23610, partial [Candidatus Binatia bacterium]
MHCVLVSHFHWDREWYRPFEAYRARLVDAVDRVLDLLAADPGYYFLLDGQTVLLEDYLAIRPERRPELERGLRQGRLAAGPWYVQPDSLLPSGEAHVRNLLLGRRVGAALGPVSRVGYVPDSFGHPAQLPQILAGFGIATFIYWRGNGDEILATGPRYRWVAPDGSALQASLLTEGYFAAACLPGDVELAARGLADLAARAHAAGGDPVLLMNGFDHMLPDGHTGAVAAALAQRSGATVTRGTLEQFVAQLPPAATTYRGELVGGRLANLLPGVWSTRLPIKLANRRCETLLEAWAEPWAALGHRLGLPDERAALQLAWRAILQNQAHDSICGCSLDPVCDAVAARYTEAEGLARQTVARLLERLAGLDAERRVPETLEQTLAVFNPSPQPRTDLVRVPLDAYPAMRLPLGVPAFAPLSLAASDPPGFEIDGRPVRVVPSDDPTRARWLPGQTPFDLELVVADVPALGCRRLRVTPCAPVRDVVDDGREIAHGDMSVTLEQGGTLRVRCGAHHFPGLLAVEDVGDRGDTYDFDAVEETERSREEMLTAETRSTRREADRLRDLRVSAVNSFSWQRTRHPAGISTLAVTRVLHVPAGLDEDRERRSSALVPLRLTVEARLAAGVPRVDLAVRVDNPARDHRLRLCFPTGRPAATYRAATTFDAAERSTAARADAGWMHRAPTTFAHQGWVSANGLTVLAPGLPEAEVTPDGTIAITLLRAVGWLARYDLRSRPGPAGPPIETPGAQLLGAYTAHLALLAGDDPAA